MATTLNNISKSALWLILATFITFGCSRERCNTPIGDAHCQIEPNSPLYNAINNVGGYVYLVGGHHGLVVIRTSYADFVCYERTCPHCLDIAVEADNEWGGGVMKCPKCGSKFSTYTDGMPLDGSLTQCPLYEYSTSYDGEFLYIY